MAWSDAARAAAAKSRSGGGGKKSKGKKHVKLTGVPGKVTKITFSRSGKASKKTLSYKDVPHYN